MTTKINFGQQILGFKNTPILNADNQPLTLGEVVLISINTPGPLDADMVPETKVKLFKLGIKASQDAEVHLDQNEITLLRERIGAVCSPIVTGRAFELLGS